MTTETTPTERIVLACQLIRDSHESPDLSSIASQVGYSPYHFHRLFKKIMGVTPKAYASEHRMERVRENLQSNPTVTETIYQAGFNSNSRFYERSEESLGMTPSQFRHKGAGTHIQFAVGTCTLGEILVAATTKGICAIFLGPDADTLVNDLQERFARAELSPGDETFQQWVALAITAVEHPERKNEIPIDLIGTAFQIRVWEALREIPPGSTLTYQEIAERIGQPTSARAVGNACGSNPVAVLVPCHRVIRTNSSLGGYRWGIEIKTELLKRETET